MDITAKLDTEQKEVYYYLVDSVGYDEFDAYDIVKEGEYTLYDDFESFIYETLEANGCKVPSFVEFDYVKMWLRTFAHCGDVYKFVDAPELKRIPDSMFPDSQEFKYWEFDFMEAVNKSRFLEIHD